MKLMSLKQYMKMSKPALIRKITKTLKAMPKKRLAVLCYNITKSKLPRLKVIKQKALTKRKIKRKKLTPKMKKARISLWNMLTPEQQKQFPLKRMLSL